MKVVGLITEYNPFHNGHKYHIEEAKKITGADYAVVVMSGNFVQRGTPAVIDKYSRAEMAINNGVDLVLELPVCYATASAEFFAHGAVSLLDKLGIVDFLCFGSECGDVSLMQEAAKLLINVPASFEENLLSSLKDGLTYPAARSNALKLHLSSASNHNFTNAKALSSLLMEPNNILGIEYLKAIYNLASTMVPITIERKAAHYHEKELADQKASDTVISSATAIRNALHNTESLGLSQAETSVPKNVYDILCARYQKNYPITEEDFSLLIKYKLLSEDNQALTRYVDITSDLADRMKNLSGYDISISKLAKDIKTKNMTLTRINRALIHLLLNIYSDTFQKYNQNGYAAYARVLGIKKESSHLLRKITKSGRIPVITKVSKACEQLNSLGMNMLSEDIFATHLYNQVVNEKYHTSILNEYKHGIYIL